MIEPRIIDRGRGPEIEGTRITVYDVLDYHLDGWHRDMIADTFDLSSPQVEVAIRYIEEHRDEVMAVYQEMLERDARGNPPELQAKLDALRGRASRWRRNSASQGAGGEGCGAFWRTLMSSGIAPVRSWRSGPPRPGEISGMRWDCRSLTSRRWDLSDRSPDSLIWRICQREQLVLITANRESRRPRLAGDDDSQRESAG